MENMFSSIPISLGFIIHKACSNVKIKNDSVIRLDIVRSIGANPGNTTYNSVIDLMLVVVITTANGGQSLWTTKIIPQKQQNARRDSTFSEKKEVLSSI